MRTEMGETDIEKLFKKTYTEADKGLLREYIGQMTETERRTMWLAYNHLESSFDLLRSGGFVSWKKGRERAMGSSAAK